jgi:methyl-accepting chemotaxis protein
MERPGSKTASPLGRVLQKARDITSQVRQTAEKVHRQAEETRRLSAQARRRSEATRKLARSNRRETDAASGSISQSLDEATEAAHGLAGDGDKRGG